MSASSPRCMPKSRTPAASRSRRASVDESEEGSGDGLGRPRSPTRRPRPYRSRRESASASSPISTSGQTISLSREDGADAGAPVAVVRTIDLTSSKRPSEMRELSPGGGEDPARCLLLDGRTRYPGGLQVRRGVIEGSLNDRYAGGQQVEDAERPAGGQVDQRRRDDLGTRPRSVPARTEPRPRTTRATVPPNRDSPTCSAYARAVCAALIANSYSPALYVCPGEHPPGGELGLSVARERGELLRDPRLTDRAVHVQGLHEIPARIRCASPYQLGIVAIIGEPEGF